MYHDGAFYIAEGGEMEGGRILRITPDGKITALVSNLPSMGDHHTNGPAIGPDGAVYFGQGTAMNSAVVGEDNNNFGWLRRKPRFHDTPCQDVTLSGQSFSSKDVVHGGEGTVMTGPFLPFGTVATANQVIKGSLPCNGAIMKVSADGGKPELVAWAFRYPFGLAFSPDGKLYVTDNGYDDRGSRPVWGAGDHLWAVTSGAWYGWPDYSRNLPLAESQFRPPAKAWLKPLLTHPPGAPSKPAAILGVHASVDGIAFSHGDAFGYPGQAFIAEFIAEFGDQAPVVGKVIRPVGFKIVRVNVATGLIQDFATNRGKTNGPASWLGRGGLERPLGLHFNKAGDALYVADLGVLRMSDKNAFPLEKTGVIWRITHPGAAR